MPYIIKTQPCPCCQSERAGLLVNHSDITAKLINKNLALGMKTGERTMGESSNVFCTACYTHFSSDITPCAVSELEYSQLLTARGLSPETIRSAAVPVKKKKKHKLFKAIRPMLPDFSDFNFSRSDYYNR